MTKSEKIYLDWYRFAKGFDWQFDTKGQDQKIIAELLQWLNNDEDLFREFLFTIINNDTDKHMAWIIEAGLELRAIRHKKGAIRAILSGEKTRSTGSGQKSRAFPEPSQAEITEAEKYHRDREEYKKWVLMVRAKRKELQNPDWIPSEVSPAFRDNMFYRPDVKVDGRPMQGRRPDSELPEGIKRINK